MSVIEAIALKKNYGQFHAVNGIDFSIKKGECYGFLGPNGAGKTTTVKMIHGFLPISGGSLQVLGKRFENDAPSIKAKIGVVAQDNNLDRDLTVIQNLIAYGRYFGIPKAVAITKGRELLEFLQLESKSNEPIMALSGGMQRRLSIARALINSPLLLILDEPTTGLDPQARHLIWQRIQTLKKQGVTVILTTHYMEEAEKLCDRVAIMDKGSILMEGKPSELIKKEIGNDVIEAIMKDGDMEKLTHRLDQLSISHETDGDHIFIYSDKATDILPEVRKFEYESAVNRVATLEDLFLKLAGRSLDE